MAYSPAVRVSGPDPIESHTPHRLMAQLAMGVCVDRLPWIGVDCALGNYDPESHTRIRMADSRKFASQTRVQAHSEVLSTAQFWRVFIVAVLVNPCLHFLLNWPPTYFSQESAVAPVGLKGILI